MYGTIARVKIDPTKIEKLKTVGDRIGVGPGQVARYAYRMDADPDELFLVAVLQLPR